jgi:hypothetical protein
MVEMPLTEDYKPITLEIVLFIPRGDEPLPLLLSHYSWVGRGDLPALYCTSMGTRTRRGFFREAWLNGSIPTAQKARQIGGLVGRGLHPRPLALLV